MQAPDPKPPYVMPEEEFNLVLKALIDRRTTLPCGRCGNTQFELQPFYTNFSAVPSFSMAASYGPYVPAAVVACKNCGNLSFHSLAHLGVVKIEPPDGGEQGA